MEMQLNCELWVVFFFLFLSSGEQSIYKNTFINLECFVQPDCKRMGTPQYCPNGVLEVPSRLQKPRGRDKKCLGG